MFEMPTEAEPVVVIEGDCLDGLRSVPDASVQCCVTSPPYYGLRDYGTASWEGGDAGCEHRVRDARTVSGGEGKQYTNQGSNRVFSGDCICGARRVDRQIGLEETPAAYVAKMVAVFREVRRVLRDDGTLWLNLGDSYSGGGGYSPGSPSNQGRVGFNGAAQSKTFDSAKRRPRDGYKPKDLLGIPWRVAFALQDDGWYLRQDIIWSKPNPMPESVTDRCTKAHEYLFLLSKQPRYYYDAAAIAEPSTDPESLRGRGARNADKFASADPDGKARTRAGFAKLEGKVYATRNRRSVWHVAPEPFAGAHFAVMPTKLVEPCILAGSRKGDIILDPFLGSGTVADVAVSHWRRAIGCELNPEYAAIARARIAEAMGRGKGSLFTELV